MNDVTLSPDQRRAFDSLHEWMRAPTSLMTLGGYAGTGKTTLVSLLARVVGETKRIAFCAPTGRAASVMGRKLRENGVSLVRHSCSTLHALAALPVEDPETGEISGWMKRSELPGFDLIVVDEASMVSADLFEMLTQFSIPILAVGDHGQLPPIMSRGGFNLMAKPKVRLERIHRQAESSPIIQLATRVREGEDIEPWHADGVAVEWVDKREWKSVLERVYGLNLLRKPLDSVVLCQTNRVRTQFNVEARRIQGRGPEPEDGDVVVCLKNVKWAGVYNGFRGLLREPDLIVPKELEELEGFGKSRCDHVLASVSFPAERQLLGRMRLCRHQFGRPKTISSYADLLEVDWEVSSWHEIGLLFDYGYAMTVHKAQGSEWPLVVLCKEPQGWHMSTQDYRRWLYTAVTRASEKLVVLG